MKLPGCEVVGATNLAAFLAACWQHLYLVDSSFDSRQKCRSRENNSMNQCAYTSSDVIIELHPCIGNV